MNYKSLFKENAPLINIVFTKPYELKHIVEFFLSKTGSFPSISNEESDIDESKIQEALQSFLKNYVEPAIEQEAHKDATATNNSEFMIYQTVINKYGDISKAKTELQNTIRNSDYSNIYEQAELSYNYLVSHYNLYKNK
jgi:hypothetical protein